MGREIRMVPKNYEHPLKYCAHNNTCTTNGIYGKCYQPMYDQHINDAFNEWFEGLNLWLAGKHSWQIKYPDDKDSENSYINYVEYSGTSPDPEYYRNYKDEDATWFQVFQTVSEGCPVSPPFETKEELIKYLVDYGDFWDQKRGAGGMSEEAAANFVNSGWACSFIADSKGIHEGKNYIKTDDKK